MKWQGETSPNDSWRGNKDIHFNRNTFAIDIIIIMQFLYLSLSKSDREEQEEGIKDDI